MRNRCTLMPVTPTMSARAQRSKSIGSTFSSIRVTVCSPGRQRRQQRQACDRQVGPLAHERQGVLHPPVGDLEPRIDQDDVGHPSRYSPASQVTAGSSVPPSPHQVYSLHPRVSRTTR